MILYNMLQSDIKQAMLSKNTIKRDCLRMVVSEIKNQTVNVGKDITDDICLKVIKKFIKQHEDSIENCKLAGRFDLIEKEAKEKDYLCVYIPSILTEEETIQVINNILEFTEQKKSNMGFIMRQLPENVDKKIAAKYLNKILK